MSMLMQHLMQDTVLPFFEDERHGKKVWILEGILVIKNATSVTGADAATSASAAPSGTELSGGAVAVLKKALAQFTVRYDVRPVRTPLTGMIRPQDCSNPTKQIFKSEHMHLGGRTVLHTRGKHDCCAQPHHHTFNTLACQLSLHPVPLQVMWPTRTHSHAAGTTTR
jgi:hypothetical protein